MGLRNIVIAVGLATVSAAIAAQTARDQISIVGSSTVYPFATIVAERFGQTTEFPDQTEDQRTRSNSVISLTHYA